MVSAAPGGRDRCWRADKARERLEATAATGRCRASADHVSVLVRFYCVLRKNLSAVRGQRHADHTGPRPSLQQHRRGPFPPSPRTAARKGTE